MSGRAGPPERLANTIRWIGFFLGPVLGLLAFWLIPAAQFDADGKVVSGLTPAGRATVGVGAVMAVWWITEAIPLSATALLPLVLFPLAGVAGVKEAAAPYANEVVFLFLGGFILGLAMERWGLHKRVALVTVLIVGTGPKRVIGGIMLATALVSLWVNNTSTTMMMLPIGMSVIALVGARSAAPGAAPGPARSPDPNFDSTMVLGVAYAATIGGVGTLIGTAPNVIMKGYVETALGREMPFANWLVLGLPMMAVYLLLAWVYLTCVCLPVRLREIPGGRSLIREELRALGGMSRGECTVLLVFACAVALWIAQPALAKFGKAHGFALLAGLNDATIAVMAALALFVIPVRAKRREFAMDWETAAKLPWGVLLLFGGGLSLAAAITANGVDVWIGRFFAGLGGLPLWTIVLVVSAAVIFLSEFASNTAVATAMLPILGAAAPALGVDAMPLVIAATLAASLAFMMPVGTPPNAIAFGTGRVSMRQMMLAGLGLNVIGVVLIPVFTLLVGHLVSAAK